VSINERRLTIILGADDALLLQGTLRAAQDTYRDNDVVLPMLKRLESILDRAQRGNELDAIEKVLGG
jgi:hypothetical protein